MHLLQIWSLSHDRRRATLSGLSPDDILWQFDFDTHYQKILSTLQAATEQPAITQELQCPYCSYLAPLPANLTRHLRTTHHISVAPVLFRMLRDAKQGTPQCMHCHRIFASIRNLRQHIHLSSCHLFDEHLAWQEPLADSCDLRRMVLAPSWTELWHQTDTLQKLRHECALCQHWAPNNRALSEHLHREHRSTWHRTQSLAQSLMHHLPSGACSACGHQGPRSHVCPVFRQLVIVRHLADLEVTTKAYVSSIDENEELAIETPKLSTPTKRNKELYIGLVTQGRPSRAFQPARDAFEGEPQCAHCYSIHNCINALQKHIENGSCAAFDPQKGMGSHVPGTWQWLLDLASNPADVLAHDEAMRIISSFCVLCGRHVRRSGAIITHLHADAIITKILQRFGHCFADMLQDTKTCVCGLKQAYKGHRCHVLYQIFALHHLAKPPLSVTEEKEEQQAWFQARRHEAELQGASMLSCAICSQKCDPMKLLTHLLTHPESQHVPVDLLAVATPKTKPCCCFCDQAASSQGPCPLALNLCLAFQRHGPGRTSVEGGRLHGPDGRYGGWSSCRERDTAKQAPKRRKATAHSNAAEESIGPHKNVDPACPAARIPTTGLGDNGSICAFFARRGQGCASTHSQGSQGMEGASTEATSPGATQAASPAPFDAGRLASLQPTPESQCHRRDLAEGAEVPDDKLRWNLAVSHVRCEAEAADQDIAAWDPYGSDAPSAAGTGGNLSQQPADPQVQSSEEDQRYESIIQYLPMAHPGDTSQQPPLGDSGSAVPQQHVVDDLGKTPPTPTEIESIGAAAGEGLTRPIMIPEALDACLRLQMQNQGNDCSVHANVQAFLWGAFRCEHLMWSDLGHGQTAIQAILSTFPTGILLRQLPAWDDFWQTWGRHTSQRDALEFLECFLPWCNPNFLCCTWERRVEVENTTSIYDQGSKWLPPTLTLSLEEKEVSLQTLIDRWHAYQGMETRFVEASDMLAFHVDRFFRDDTGAVQRLDTGIYGTPWRSTFLFGWRINR